MIDLFCRDIYAQDLSTKKADNLRDLPFHHPGQGSSIWYSLWLMPIV
jgi:hypothetical protein